MHSTRLPWSVYFKLAFYSACCRMNTLRDYTQIGSFDDMVWNIAALSPAMMHKFLFSSHQIWFVSTLLTHCLIKGIYNNIQNIKEQSLYFNFSIIPKASFIGLYSNSKVIFWYFTQTLLSAVLSMWSLFVQILGLGYKNRAWDLIK